MGLPAHRGFSGFLEDYDSADDEADVEYGADVFAAAGDLGLDESDIEATKSDYGSYSGSTPSKPKPKPAAPAPSGVVPKPPASVVVPASSSGTSPWLIGAFAVLGTVGAGIALARYRKRRAA